MELCRIILHLGNEAMNAGLDEDVEISIDFDDSIIEDKTAERNNDRQDLAVSIMNDWGGIGRSGTTRTRPRQRRRFQRWRIWRLRNRMKSNEIPVSTGIP